MIHQCHQVCLCRLRNKLHVTPLSCHGNLIILTWGLDKESEGVWGVTAPVRMWPWKYPKYWGEIHQNLKDKISVFAALPLMEWWSHFWVKHFWRITEADLADYNATAGRQSQRRSRLFAPDTAARQAVGRDQPLFYRFFKEKRLNHSLQIYRNIPINKYKPTSLKAFQRFTFSQQHLPWQESISSPVADGDTRRQVSPSCWQQMLKRHR